MFGVVHEANIGVSRQMFNIVWCVLLGWISMPMFIGYWLESKMKKK
jgi:hypothetical protein